MRSSQQQQQQYYNHKSSSSSSSGHKRKWQQQQKAAASATSSTEAAAAVAQQQQVVPFIEYCCGSGDGGKYIVHDEAVKFLESIDGPFGVITIVGPYRTGKSTLLNRCLLQQQALTVGSTVNACTKGILLVKQIIEGPKILDGNTRALPVIVLDTEGLGSVDATNTHDVRIFSMALLLSSLFIYNSVGSIDETAISNLSLVSNICSSLHLSSSSSSNVSPPSSDLLEKAEGLGKEAFPPLLWIVRDFALQLVDHHNVPIDERQYLENSLKPIAIADKDGGSGSSCSNVHHLTQEKNDVRAFIRACFPIRHCITMVRPVTDETVLQSLSKSVDVPVRKLFQEQLDYVRRFVLHSVRQKRMSASNEIMTGKGLASYARMLVRSINEGRHPVIHDAWAVISNEQHREVRDAAVSYFKTRMNSSEFTTITSEEAIDKVIEETVLWYRDIIVSKGMSSSSSSSLQQRLEELSVHLETVERQHYSEIVQRLRESRILESVLEMGSAVADLCAIATTAAAAVDTEQQQQSSEDSTAAAAAAFRYAEEATSAVESIVAHSETILRQQQHHHNVLLAMPGVVGGSVTAAAAAAQQQHHHLLLHKKTQGWLRELAEKILALLEWRQNHTCRIQAAFAEEHEQLLHEVAMAQAELQTQRAQLEETADRAAKCEEQNKELELAVANFEKQLDEARADLQTKTCQASASHEEQLQEAERRAQTEYLAQLERIKLDVTKKMDEAAMEYEKAISEAAAEVQSAQNASRQHEAVRVQLQALVSDLRADVARLHETRLTEQLKWAHKLADMEKAVVTASAQTKRLEELYDPSLAKRAEACEREKIQFSADLSAKTQELSRAKQDLGELKAESAKWQKLYYDNYCKHQEEMLLLAMSKQQHEPAAKRLKMSSSATAAAAASVASSSRSNSNGITAISSSSSSSIPPTSSTFPFSSQ